MILMLTILIGTSVTPAASGDLEADIALLRKQLAQMQLERDNLKRQVEELREALDEIMQHDAAAIEALLEEIRSRPKTNRVPDRSITLTLREVDSYPMQPHELAERDRQLEEIRAGEEQLRSEQERLRKMEAENAKVQNDWNHHKAHCGHAHNCSRCRSKPASPNSPDALGKARLAINNAETRLKRARAALARIERECKGRILVSGEDEQHRLVQIIFTGTLAERAAACQPGDRIAVRGSMMEADSVRTLLQGTFLTEIRDDS